MQKTASKEVDDSNVVIKEYTRTGKIEFNGELSFDIEAEKSKLNEAVDIRTKAWQRKLARDEEAKNLKDKKPANKPKPNSKQTGKGKAVKEPEKTQEDILKEEEDRKVKELLEQMRQQDEEILAQELYSTEYIFCYLNKEGKEKDPFHFVTISRNKFQVSCEHTLTIGNMAELKSYQKKLADIFFARVKKLLTIGTTGLKRGTPSASKKDIKKKSSTEQSDSEIRKAIATSMQVNEDNIEHLESFQSLPLANFLLGKKYVNMRVEGSQTFHNLAFRYSIDQQLVDSSIQNHIFPLMITIHGVKNLPNEPWLSEHCKGVYVTCNCLDIQIKTEPIAHSNDVKINFSNLLYLKDIERYRSFLENNPLSMYVRDRDPKSGKFGTLCGKADFWLTPLLRGNDLELKLSSPIVHVELEAPPTPIVESTSKAPSRAVSRKQTSRVQKPPVQVSSPPPPIEEYNITRGAYETCLSELKISVALSNVFPEVPVEKRKNAVVITTELFHFEFLSQLEQSLLLYKPPETKKEQTSRSSTPSKQRASRPSSRLQNNQRSDLLNSTAFWGYEVCDGVKRIVVIEASTADATNYLLNCLHDYVEDNKDKRYTGIKQIFNPKAYYTHSIYSTLVNSDPPEVEVSKESRANSPKPSRSQSTTGSRTSDVPESVRPVAVLIPIRLQKSLSQITIDDKVYRQKKRDAIEAAIRLCSITDSCFVEEVFESKLLPSAQMIKELEKQFAGDLQELTESDRQALKKHEEQEQKEREDLERKKREEEEKRLEIHCVDDFINHLGKEMTFVGTPLFEAPNFLPKASSMTFLGENTRMKLLGKQLKKEEKIVQPESLVEQKFWMFLTDLNGYVLLSFPPFYEDLPPPHVMSIFQGTLDRTPKLNLSKRIFPWKEHESSIRFNPNTECFFGLVVSAWEQQTNKVLNSRISHKYLRGKNPELQCSKNFVAENKQVPLTQHVTQNVLAKQQTLGMGTLSRTLRPLREVPVRNEGEKSFYLFNKAKDRMEGRQVLHTRKIRALEPQEKLFHDHLYRNPEE